MTTAWLLILALAAAPPDGATAGHDGGMHKYTRIHVGEADGVIVTAEKGDRNAWTPDEASIHAFEHGLADFLKSAKPPEDPDLYKKLGKYKRQYIGKTRGKKRALYVVFACEEPPDWQDVVRIRKDGGTCFFEVEYLVDANRYQNLNVHRPS
jgi:hypothetical protein